MIDPTIWQQRARITVRVEIARALDGGVRIDDLENAVRSTRCPFDGGRGVTPALERAYKVWLDALDAAFAPGRSPRRPPTY